MSTDLHDRTTNPAPEPREPEKPKPALSFTQVAGGALAAMTAAALGSRLSVAGTLVGAALASVIAAVAGSVYTASLRRGRDTVNAVWNSRGRRTGAGGTTASPTSVDLSRGEPGRLDPVVATTDRGGAEPEPAAAPAKEERRRVGWKPVLAGALLMFAIAAVALTGLELATGRALSGGSGTTLGQVAEGGSTASSEPTTPRPSASPSASARPTATPSAAPTTVPTQPSAEPTPSATAEPSTTASPSPSPTASGSETPAAGGVAGAVAGVEPTS